MSTLQVIAYNVRFGDAILLAVPDTDGEREVTRHILIDVGNVLAGVGGLDDVFEPVLRDVLDRLDGRPIDLYVMSHEHLDHVKGMSRAREAGVEVPVEYAWLTASARPGYYDDFAEARQRAALARHEFARINLAAARRGLLSLAPVRSFLENNDAISTGSCVDLLRGLASKRTSYVHRGFRPRAGLNHPFRQVRLSVWAPEEDTSSYYGRLTPFVPSTRKTLRRPPAGVDPRSFRKLMTYMECGLGDNILAIDRATNNTSVVLCVEWRNWRLLFPGDAELASWAMMARHGVLRPVHLLKVSHHASHNGTPADGILDQVLPRRRPNARPRYALVSTWPDTYAGVPDDLTIQRLAARVDQVVSTGEVLAGTPVTIELEG